MTFLVLDAQAQRARREPTQARPAREAAAAGPSTTVEGEVRGDAGAAAQKRHAATRHFKPRMEAELRGWKAECAPSRSTRAAEELRKGRLAINSDVQYVRRFIRRELAKEFKVWATSDPAGRPNRGML